MAAEQADVILFLVDSKTGINADDQAVANILRSFEQARAVVVNKLDNPNDTNAMWEFMQLGLGEPWPVSALHGTGTGDLLDEVVQRFPEPTEEEHDGIDAINVAIIGRPNAGKSSLTNKLTNNDRSIVSDVAGTTRERSIPRSSTKDATTRSSTRRGFVARA